MSNVLDWLIPLLLVMGTTWGFWRAWNWVADRSYQRELRNAADISLDLEEEITRRRKERDQ